MKKFAFLTLLLFSSFAILNAQNAKNPFFIGFGASAIDYVSPPAETLDLGNTEFSKAFSFLQAGYALNNSLTFALDLSLLEMEQEFLGKNPLIVSNLQAQYHFANGYILPVQCKLDPYLFAGGGIAGSFSQLNGNLGLGLNVWVNEHLGLFAQGSWNAPEKASHFLEYNLGLKIRYGSKEEANQGETVVVEEPKMSKDEAQNQVKDFAKNIQFETNSDVIKSESFKSLDAIASLMKNVPKLNAVVEGHTDNTGDADYNKQLSEKRAQAVVNYLAKQGVELSRLSAKGYGQEKPIESNDTKEGRAANRRVEVNLL